MYFKKVFQQDGAACHTSNLTQKWLEKNLNLFLNKSEWPPNSPDLNPLDYFYWDAVVNKMNICCFSNVIELRNEIQSALSKIPVENIKSAIECFNKRVRNVENAKGKYCHK